VKACTLDVPSMPLLVKKVDKEPKEKDPIAKK